jgi:hypothetical protein
MNRIEKKILIFTLLVFFIVLKYYPQDCKELRIIHVLVALCDNENQGIVPVAPKLGNGEDLKNNLYWGARYGVKTFFKHSNHWQLLESIKKPSGPILERCVFKHNKSKTYMVADAYRGIKIKKCIMDYLDFVAGNLKKSITLYENSKQINLKIQGYSNLIVYLGHNGLMDFSLREFPKTKDNIKRDTIILGCHSKRYFNKPLGKTNAYPVLWTTGLMAPEAYILENYFEGWILKEDNKNLLLRAAKAYNKYQRCGLNAALRLFTSGY